MTPRRIAAIGMFDGVHLGHRHLLAELRREGLARGLEPLAVTFANHPLTVVRPESAPPLLSTPREKAVLLAAEGVVPILLPFDSSLRLSTAEQFLSRLHGQMGVDALLLGFDNRFGHGAPASFDQYRSLGAAQGVEVLQADELQAYGSKVSSSEIRRLLAEGQLDRANALLGRPYSLSGVVEHGRQIGRTIGFPTANIAVSPQKLLPANGVYAVDVAIDDAPERHRAVMNIGTRPTVSGLDRSVEVFIPGLHADLYGRSLSVGLLRRIRDERKFPSLDALKAQIALDLQQALDLTC